MLQLNLSNFCISYTDDSASGLLTLFKKIINIKVLILDNCYLGFLSLENMAAIVNAFSNNLEVLSMHGILVKDLNAINVTGPPDIIEKSNRIIGILANKISLRYVSLTMILSAPISMNDDYVYEKWKTLYNKVYEFRQQSPIYIHWNNAIET